MLVFANILVTRFARFSTRKVLQMSYQKKIDEMVGKHVADFQMELTLARKMAGSNNPPPMPYGYPIAVYRPLHVCKVPQVRRFIAHTGGKLSNGVPRILRTELVGEYILGIYNPHRCCHS